MLGWIGLGLSIYKVWSLWRRLTIWWKPSSLIQGCVIDQRFLTAYSAVHSGEFKGRGNSLEGLLHRIRGGWWGWRLSHPKWLPELQPWPLMSPRTVRHECILGQGTWPPVSRDISFWLHSVKLLHFGLTQCASMPHSLHSLCIFLRLLGGWLTGKDLV